VQFWLERGAAPRCTLEALAAAVFAHHTAACPEEAFGSQAGAEWWVQVKEPGSASAEKREVGFHWDKDERFHAAYGFYLYPQARAGSLWRLLARGWLAGARSMFMVGWCAVE